MSRGRQFVSPSQCTAEFISSHLKYCTQKLKVQLLQSTFLACNLQYSSWIYLRGSEYFEIIVDVCICTIQWWQWTWEHSQHWSQSRRSRNPWEFHGRREGCWCSCPWFLWWQWTCWSPSMRLWVPHSSSANGFDGRLAWCWCNPRCHPRTPWASNSIVKSVSVLYTWATSHQLASFSNLDYKVRIEEFLLWRLC